ncbi:MULTISPECIES: EF-hand domain-containing protein [unclassified Sphingomonas]|jgi:hypothetical protein|uniref:EF-hand domain-containing protein n=1 Tax=unclassified Sphingomonas TaxID=196159 RepID=UPI0004DFA65A|nr:MULTISPECIES: EF-hand domain-containing protein [unclassified Sphingomonas]KHA63964.1 histidine kinase [Sphingomonas sp. Ant20]MBD8470910.1 histidine kinase [Sphingomonas sp. CFBP 8765]MDY1006679.1 EF-hand domain-containing protein [Sphingomonas sp. CFBP9019]
MWRYLTGGAALIALIGAAILGFGGKVRSGPVLAPQPTAQAQTKAQADGGTDPLPSMAPRATDATREQRRFQRYDKDRDGAVTRDEYLVARRKAYTKLDVDGDGRLSFDEWAVKATTKFAGADADKSGAMTAPEFATTAVRRKPSSRAACPPVPPSSEES